MRVRQIAKHFLQTFVPSLTTRIQGYTQHAHVVKIEKQRGIPRLLKDFQAAYEPRVLNGPFKGMNYLLDSVGSAILPKLLGTYELEIQDAISEALAIDYELVLDIGCAEGYYAVGFARAKPNTRVLAFDLSPVAHRKCRKLANLNNATQNLEIRGQCTEKLLSQLAEQKILIICDCEGCEWELLDPNKISGLAASDLLVELHCIKGDQTTQRFLDRFAGTHEIVTFKPLPRDGSECGEILCNWSPEDRKIALNEMRAFSQIWVWAKSRSSQA